MTTCIRQSLELDKLLVESKKWVDRLWECFERKHLYTWGCFRFIFLFYRVGINPPDKLFLSFKSYLSLASIFSITDSSTLSLASLFAVSKSSKDVFSFNSPIIFSA